MHYKKFEKLPEYLSKNGIDSPLKSDMSEREIAQAIEKMDLSDEMIDLTGMKLDDKNVGHNVIYQNLSFNKDFNVRIVYEASYEEYDHDYDTWQYIYTTPLGWLE